LELTIHTLEVMPDHVPMFIEFDPRWAVAEIASRFKGTTSHALRQEFAELRSRLPTLRLRSYYAGTVGHVSESTVRRYIEAQKTR
jgi:putative transposase